MPKRIINIESTNNFLYFFYPCWSKKERLVNSNSIKVSPVVNATCRDLFVNIWSNINKEMVE